MKLDEFLRGSKRGAATTMATDLGVSQPTVSDWCTGKKPVPVDRCVQIERLTGGAVTCEELRPDKAADFAYLRERGALYPMSIATPATAGA